MYSVLFTVFSGHQEVTAIHTIQLTSTSSRVANMADILTTMTVAEGEALVVANVGVAAVAGN